MIYIFRILPLDSELPYIDMFYAESEQSVIDQLISAYNVSKRSRYRKIHSGAGVLQTDQTFDHIFTVETLPHYIYTVAEYIQLYGQCLMVEESPCKMVDVCGVEIELCQSST
jgi:hypothetical protein